MTATSIIFRREMASYLRSPIGYTVAALSLLVAGMMFQAFALGSGEKLSADVLRQYFWFMSGIVQFIGVALSFHVITNERTANTITLLNTSPVRDRDIVLGKFLSVFVFLGLTLAASVYMPLLIMVNGKISMSQLLVGYLGLWLLGGVSAAIGVFASSLTRHMLVAAVIALCINGVLVFLFPMAKVVDAPLVEVFQNLDLWHIHFQGGFMVGVLNLKDVVYYLAFIYFFLLLATKTLELKRWQ
ncbi:MAG TPA: ABC transporter permease subunit [Kofleriaceae bacterium]|nr:ABC transporter permease subunit [Kofleriaceae bacterium]